MLERYEFNRCQIGRTLLCYSQKSTPERLAILSMKKMQMPLLYTTPAALPLG